MFQHFYGRHEEKHTIGFCTCRFNDTNRVALSCCTSDIYDLRFMSVLANRVCWFSTVLREVFPRTANFSYSRFPPARGKKATFDSIFSLAKNQDICTRQRSITLLPSSESQFSRRRTTPLKLCFFGNGKRRMPHPSALLLSLQLSKH